MNGTTRGWYLPKGSVNMYADNTGIDDGVTNMDRTAAVVGAGTMGMGIAYSFAVGGYETTVVEPDVDRAKHVRTRLRAVADDGVTRGKLTEKSAADTMGRLFHVRDVTDIPPGLGIIVETVPEQMDLKVRILRAAESTGPRLLASNTSALSINELANEIECPERFLGAHFFNPVWSIHLVEVIRGHLTADWTVAEMIDTAASIGKETAVVRDAPGFATSRLDLVTSLEAIRMIEAGVAEPADIDRAVRLAYRHPVGPLKLSDIVGLDVRLHTAEHLSSLLGQHFAPPQLLIDMVARGDLGQKSGKGFYEWK